MEFSFLAGLEICCSCHFSRKYRCFKTCFNLFRKWKCYRRSSFGSRFSGRDFQNLEVGHKEVKEILEHDAVKGVSLTGSGKAGGEVASIAGLNIKKSLLELAEVMLLSFLMMEIWKKRQKQEQNQDFKTVDKPVPQQKDLSLMKKLKMPFFLYLLKNIKNMKLEILWIKKLKLPEWQDRILLMNWKHSSTEHWKMVLKSFFLWKEFLKMNSNRV
jgi:hypothetical protein